MLTQRILTSAVVFLVAFAFSDEVLSDPPSKAGEPQFAFTSPFLNIDDDYDLASCSDENEDGQCDNSIAFITKSGHWGIRIPGVESDGAEPYRVCMTFWDTAAADWGALILIEGLHTVGPKNMLSAGGDVYTDTSYWLETVYLPGFTVMRYDEAYPTGCYGHLVEFMSGAQVY